MQNRKQKQETIPKEPFDLMKHFVENPPRLGNLAGAPPTPRRDAKDQIFRLLYQDKNRLLELYNAVNRTNYTDPEELIITTLENAIYLGMKNDLAFVINFRLSLYEHQSTKNANMPLRNLFYVAGVYSKLVPERAIYSSHLLKLPAPHFITFYTRST